MLLEYSSSPKRGLANIKLSRSLALIVVTCILRSGFGIFSSCSCYGCSSATALDLLLLIQPVLCLAWEFQGEASEGTKRPHKRKDPTNHNLWNSRYLEHYHRHVGFICCCGFTGPYSARCGHGEARFVQLNLLQRPRQFPITWSHIYLNQQEHFKLLFALLFFGSWRTEMFLQYSCYSIIHLEGPGRLP